MDEKQGTVFSLLVDYLNDFEDLAYLRIAISDKKDIFLYYGWLRYLKNGQEVLNLKKISPYFHKVKCITDLILDKLDKAFTDMKKEGRFNPFDTLVVGLEDVKAQMDRYMSTAKGDMPEIYTDEYEEWEGYNEYARGMNRDITFEDFWKDGGREGEAISRDYNEWVDTEDSIKLRWTRAIDHTNNILKHSNVEKFDKSLNTVTGRRNILTELRKRGLTLRSNSALCRDFISYGKRDLFDVVNVMTEMNFLYAKTNYRSSVASSRKYHTYIEEIKLYSTKYFIEKNSERIHDIPSTLLAKVNTKFGTTY